MIVAGGEGKFLFVSAASGWLPMKLRPTPEHRLIRFSGLGKRWGMKLEGDILWVRGPGGVDMIKIH